MPSGAASSSAVIRLPATAPNIEMVTQFWLGLGPDVVVEPSGARFACDEYFRSPPLFRFRYIQPPASVPLSGGYVSEADDVAEAAERKG